MTDKISNPQFGINYFVNYKHFNKRLNELRCEGFFEKVRVESRC